MQVNYHTFSNGKRYVYVKQKDSGPVFLRNVIFLIRKSSMHKKVPEIAIVREYGAKTNRCAWEPPKGQMEWGEFNNKVRRGQNISDALLHSYMRRGVLRELSEEGKIKESEIQNLTMIPYSYTESWNTDLPNAAFKYQFWIAITNDKTMFEAQNRIHELVNDIDMVHILPHDVCEKDAIMWWSPKDGWNIIRGRFSKKLTESFYTIWETHGK